MLRQQSLAIAIAALLPLDVGQLGDAEVGSRASRFGFA
jgi:hypothetical protein